MQNLAKFLIVPVIPFLFSNTVLAATPYVSGQIGGFKSPIEEGDGGITARFAAGMLWDTTKRFKMGLETGVNLFESADFDVPVTFFDGFGVRTIDVPSHMDKTSVDVMAVFDYYIRPKFDVFFKAGTAYVWQKYVAEDKLISYNPDKFDGFAFKSALGIGYDVTKQVSVKLAVEQQSSTHSGAVINERAWPARTYTIGLQYKFC